MVKILKNIELVWNPSKGIGPFQIGVEIKKYINEFNLELVSDEMKEGYEWETYRIKGRDDIRIFSEDSKVVSILCDEYCFYKGKNLIGITIEQLINALNTKPNDKVDEIDLDDGFHYVYDFDDYSCQVWVKDNKTESFTCNAYRD
jgi:hypothetical protein